MLILLDQVDIIDVFNIDTQRFNDDLDQDGLTIFAEDRITNSLLVKVI